jgi:triacylglycerol lipase
MMNENVLLNSNDAADEISGAAVRVDPPLTLALAQASLAAYYDFQNLPFVCPANYRCVGRFTGWNDWIWSFGVEERFGLIFKYAGPQMIANRFIIAFRGTDSLPDVYSDAFWELTSFEPFRNQVSPAPQMSAGFYGIYASKGGTMAQTMQQQIFSKLPQNSSEVLITGHSLGAALSQIFTLDMKLSSPNVGIRNVNFASPRVGDVSWRTACDAAGATQRITRVINYWDIVPDYPPEIFNYVSIGAQFETSFGRCSEWDYNPLSDHSLLNLQTVLNNCVYLTPQIWTGTFQDAVNPAYWMCSDAPPQSAQPKAEWTAKFKELSAFRRSANNESSGSEDMFAIHNEAET